MSNFKDNFTSYERGVFSEMRATERFVMEGPKGEDGRPLPSRFALACAAKRAQQEQQAGLSAANNVIVLPTRKLG